MKKILLLLSIPFILSSCGDDKKNTTEQPKQKENVNSRNTDIQKIEIEKITEGPEFPDATLIIKDIQAKPIENTDSVEITFNFDVQNYELKAQTPDASTRSCNNSKDGQHIHFIIDNQPYTALYAPTHTIRIKKDSEHTLLTFLSRSYHLSLKNSTAYQAVKFKIDTNGKLTKTDAGKEPMLFYSRPKGTYLGADVENVLLDFYLINAKEGLQAGDYKIQANIAGKEFIITEWAPHFIKNLPYGKHDIQLTLTDKNGQKVGENTVKMTITLAEKEPIQ